MPDDGVPNILHESDVQKVVEREIEASVGYTGEPIDDVAAPYTLAGTFSNTEVAAAVNDLGTAVNSILAVLRTNGLIAPE